MKTYKLVLLAIVFITFANSVNAQVGIGNTSPNALLDIQASSQSGPSKTDGLLIPRIDAFPAEDPEGEQDGMLVFLTSDSTFYFWKNSTSSWIPISSNESENDENNHYVGELYGGGIVYYVFNNGANGLIASLDDMTSNSGVDWGLDGADVNNCESIWDGKTNTEEIISEGGASSDAAGLCEVYSNGSFGDWYLPSISELKLMYEAVFVINSVLEGDGDNSSNGLGVNPEETDSNGDTTNYWSSTEESSGDAYIYKFKNGHFDKKDKGDSYRVRAIRSF